MHMRKARVHHNFAPICYILGVNGIMKQNIYPTTFASHVWHLRGKFEVNLPHLPYLPLHPNTPCIGHCCDSLINEFSDCN
jgi:hypothetical protein